MPKPTVVAQLTPQGRSAIGTICLQGSQACQLIDQFFFSLSKRSSAKLAINQISVGHWKSHQDDPGEELVVGRKSQEHFEIHCHGGIAASKKILSTLIDSGCLHLSWQQWAKEQATDLIVAAAYQSLSEANTFSASKHLLAQVQGALSRSIRTMIDFLHAEQTSAALIQIEQLLANAEFGLHLTQPWQILLSGKPNVGKSSLINQIVGYSRTIVFDQPGTTRDAIAISTALGGYPIELIDSAGIRNSADRLEKLGIERAKQLLNHVDLVLNLFEATNLQKEEIENFIYEFPQGIPVINKIDLSDAPQDLPMKAVLVSCKTGHGIDTLIEKVVSQLIPKAPEFGSPLLFQKSQVEVINTAKTLIEEKRLKHAIMMLESLFDSSQW